MGSWVYRIVFLFMLTFISGTTGQCSHGQWQCTSGACVLREKVCNHLADCPDGSDESDICQTETCQDFLFQCSSLGQCVSRVKVCNGQAECEDGSDEEQPECDREDFVHVDNSKHGSATSVVSNSFVLMIVVLGQGQIL